MTISFLRALTVPHSIEYIKLLNAKRDKKRL
jgi:hypothetical protein